MANLWQDEGFGGGDALDEGFGGEDDWDEGDESLETELEDAFLAQEDEDDSSWDEHEVA